jgi:hypothetical protein
MSPTAPYVIPINGYLEFLFLTVLVRDFKRIRESENQTLLSPGDLSSVGTLRLELTSESVEIEEPPPET